jgi:hypothetical protein
MSAGFSLPRDAVACFKPASGQPTFRRCMLNPQFKITYSIYSTLDIFEYIYWLDHFNKRREADLKRSFFKVRVRRIGRNRH